MAGKITFKRDDAAKLLSIAMIGEVHDEQALGEFEAYWHAHPEIVGYDSLVDQRLDEGAVSWHGSRLIARKWNEFAGGRDVGRRTALIVLGPSQRRLAGLVAMLFPRREFQVFYTPDEALGWLWAPSGAVALSESA